MKLGKNIEINPALNVHSLETFLHSHKGISLFKPEQARVIKPLRNFRSSRSAPVLLPATHLQLLVHKKTTSLFIFPFSVSLKPNHASRVKISQASFSFSFSWLHLPFLVSLHNNSFWKYPLHFDLISQIKNPLCIKTLFSIKLAGFLPC